VLGSGYNGKVYLAKEKQNNQQYAVKKFNLRNLSRDSLEELEAEVEISLLLDHPHVARLVDVYQGQNKLSLVMECMTGGELYDRIIELQRFEEADAALAARQMLLAINYLHTHKMVHRDLKLENFLYESKESGHLKLIDFGFSKITKPNTKMATCLGTLCYMAPEVLNQSYTKECDLWSFGVIVYILLFGPFRGDEDAVVEKIMAGRYEVKKGMWDKVSSQAREFIEKLLVVRAPLRLTAPDALNHQWIVNCETDFARVSSIDRNMADALMNWGRESAVRRACMSMVAWSMSVEDRAKVRAAFLALDTDQTGTVRIHEFKQVLSTQLNISDEETTQAFKDLDNTHDEEIHYSDFLAAVASHRVQLHDDLLRETFRRFDVENDGYIHLETMEELIGKTCDGQSTEEMMQNAGVMKDGKISYEDWIKLLHESAGDNHKIAEQIIDDQAPLYIIPAPKSAKNLTRPGEGTCWGMCCIQ